MGIYEGTQKVLDGSDYFYALIFRGLDLIFTELGSCSFCLYVVLIFKGGCLKKFESQLN